MTQRTTTGDRTGAWSRAVRTPAAAAGIGYAVSWILSFIVGAPMPAVTASGDQIVTAYAGHDWPSIVSFSLQEGIPAVALAVLSLTSAVLPRWLAPLALLLAMALVASGLGYVLLAGPLSDAANVSGVLLVLVVTAAGVTLRTSR